jgi:hypothetical protein
MNKTTELAYWINERESVRMRRERGDPAPWSADPAIANVRYCNVRREDDKVTRWLAQNWRHVGSYSTLAMVMARMVNWIPTLERLPPPQQIGTSYSARAWVRTCSTIVKSIQGQKWTNAYTISTCGKKMGKEDYVFGHVLPQVLASDFDDRYDPTWLSAAHLLLTQVDGLGSFLAAQVIADLKNTKGHPLFHAMDWWDWSAHGPGSLRGLEAYYGSRVTPSGYQTAIAQCYAEVAPLIKGVGRLHMQDFQNCLCEFSKYMRVLNGGHARNGYRAM